MSDEQTITFHIRRSQPGETQARWDEFPVEAQPGMTVLDGLLRIRRRLDPTLAYRYSCRMGLCGSCGMMINGKPGLACNTQVLEVTHGQHAISAMENSSQMYSRPAKRLSSTP